MSGSIITEVHESVLRVQIDRPRKKNSLTGPMYSELADALERASGDESIRVVLLTGTGDCFSAGNDLQAFLNPADIAPRIVRFLQLLSTFSKPLVASVPGVAIGIGTTMLLHCDLVYASDGARFKLPFVDLGLVPEAASSLLLPRIVGHPRTSELLLLGETWSAQQALDAGLINAVLPQDELQDHAWERARHLATRAPAALRITKALIARADAQAVQDTIEAELQEFGDRLASPELAEAVQAFMERRPPDFSRFS